MSKVTIGHTSIEKYTSLTGYGIALKILERMTVLKDIDHDAYFIVGQLGVHDSGFNTTKVTYMWETKEEL